MHPTANQTDPSHLLGAKERLLTRGLPAALTGIGILLILGWWIQSPNPNLRQRVAGADRGEATAGGAPNKFEGRLVKGPGIAASLQGSWPRFRGPDLNGISSDPSPLARAWAEGSPKALWKTSVGEGFAAAAIWKGRVFVTDYDHAAGADALRCLSLVDGREIWRYTYPSKVKRNHGMSRTIPSVTDKHVVSLGPKCQVISVDPTTGELQWQLNLVTEFNTEVPPWYAGQCPLVDGDRLILGTGGDALVAAVDCATGKILWKSPNPRGWAMTHSSITPVEIQGHRMYVYCASGGVTGVSAEDGSILWDTPEWKISMANVPSPVGVGNGRIFLTGGYGAGSLMLQVKLDQGKWTAGPVWRLKAAAFGSTQHTPVLYQDHLFGVRADGQFVCLGLDGKIQWESGTANRFGNGPFLLAQGLAYVLNDDGLMTLVEVSTAAYKPLAKAKVLPGPDSWGPLALADGRLIARDSETMVCLDVGSK